MNKNTQTDGNHPSSNSGLFKKYRLYLFMSFAFVLAGCAFNALQSNNMAVPQYKADAFWMQPMPNNWIFGQVSSVAVDHRDHVWVLHRPNSLHPDEKGRLQNPPQNRCCVAAPAVVEYDANGKVVRAWGGPGAGYDWPKQEHGIHVDKQGNIWITGNESVDQQALKFDGQGGFLMQIGKPGKSEGSNSRTQLGQPASIESDAVAQEIYVGDGYGNKRVIVFDSNTGAYKRHWGAYGAVPDDAKQPNYVPRGTPSKQFGNPHCVKRSRDQLIYVCDRPNNRIQVFQSNGQFMKEFFIDEDTLSGSLADIAMSNDPQQKYLFVADGSNSEIYILNREDGKKVGSFGRQGRQMGEFRNLHNIAIDSKGNIYTAEAGFGSRVQRFVLQQ